MYCAPAYQNDKHKLISAYALERFNMFYAFLIIMFTLSAYLCAESATSYAIEGFGIHPGLAILAHSVVTLLLFTMYTLRARERVQLRETRLFREIHDLSHKLRSKTSILQVTEGMLISARDKVEDYAKVYAQECDRMLAWKRFAISEIEKWRYMASARLRLIQSYRHKVSLLENSRDLLNTANKIQESHLKYCQRFMFSEIAIWQAMHIAQREKAIELIGQSVPQQQHQAQARYSKPNNFQVMQRCHRDKIQSHNGVYLVKDESGRTLAGYGSYFQAEDFLLKYLEKQDNKPVIINLKTA